MYPNQFAPKHTPKSQSSPAAMNKAIGQQPHQPSTCRGRTVVYHSNTKGGAG